METRRDIKRILWHEFEHFYIDLIDENSLNNTFIDDIWISYHHYATSDHKWAGGVKTLPEAKWEAIAEDTEKTSFTLLNLISGCLFQTYFLKEIEKEDINFNKCFGFPKSFAGRGDFCKFHKLINLIREKNGQNLKLQIFFEEDLNKIYYKNLLKNKVLLKRTKDLVNSYSLTVFEKFKQEKCSDEFRYSFKNTCGLNLLKEEIGSIINKSNFRLEIIHLKEIIQQKILEDL